MILIFYFILRLKKRILKFIKRYKNYLMVRRALYTFFKLNFCWSYKITSNITNGNVTATDNVQWCIVFDLDNLSGRKIDIDDDDFSAPNTAIRFKYNKEKDLITSSRR